MCTIIREGEAISAGAKIYYAEYGDENAYPVIFLHGNGEDASVFKKQIGPFSEKFHVIMIDSRAHGRSTRGDAELTISSMADDVIAVMDEMGIKKTAVVGFSDGGNIALKAAARYPERIEKLVAAGANISTAGIKGSVQYPILLGYALLKIFSLFGEKGKQKLEIIGLMAKEPEITIEELSGIKAKTLIIAGERDVVKEEHTKLISRSIPKAGLEIIKNAGHFVFDNNAEETNGKILEFLDEKE